LVQKEENAVAMKITW